MTYLFDLLVFAALFMLVGGNLYLFFKLKKVRRRERLNELILEQLKEAQKMETVGRLAAGVAHDFNNMLAIITGASEILAVKLVKGSSLKVYPDIILKACKMASSLTSQLLVFSRNKSTANEHIDFHKCIEDSVMLLEHGISKKIKIIKDLEAKRHFVLGNHDMLQNMLLNLGFNAKDAMDDGGLMIFRTKNIRLSEKKIQEMGKNIAPGVYIEAIVKDTGRGIPKNLLDRVFEPFFTTKEIGKGNGLGLPAVHRIVTEYGGAIDVKSSNKGTSFYLYFPVVKGEVYAQEEPKYMRKLKGRVLVVDDESVLRSLLKDILGYIGLDVVEATDANEALRIYKEEGFFDVVMLDVIMPEKTGVELYKELLEVNAEIKTIFMSGYSDDRNIDEIVKQNKSVAFVAKPFQLVEVCAKISKMLGKK